jgi:hypothetical protein
MCFFSGYVYGLNGEKPMPRLSGAAWMLVGDGFLRE